MINSILLLLVVVINISLIQVINAKALINLNSRKGIVISKISNNDLFFNKLVSIRGGKKNNKKEDMSDDEDEDDSDEDEDDYEDDEDGAGFGIGRDLPLVTTLSSVWHKTPPMTQIYVGSSIFITLLSFIFNKNQWPNILHFEWQSILYKLQFWRIITSFLFFGQFDMFYPLTMQFVWQHMSQLEKLNYNTPEDFFIMLIFGCSSLIILYSLLGISMKFLGHNLATYLVYIWSRVFEGADINFMDIITLKSEMLPWFFCIQTYLLEREIPFADLLGIIAGHFYYYLSNKKIIKAPQFIINIFKNEKVVKRYLRFKNDFE